MMTSLFSVFDPTSNILTNWLIVTLILIPNKKWFISTKFSLLNKLILNKISNEFKMLIHSFTPGMTMLFMSLLYFIVTTNLLGLLPYTFTPTSHMSLTLSLSLLTWLSFNIYGWINNTNNMMAHLVPLGTPSMLTSLMVCIESISSLIRPLTLSIRLSANMIAGHLLISLLANTGPNSNTLITLTMIFLQIILLILELAVAIIQAYVFSILSVLYIAEVN